MKTFRADPDRFGIRARLLTLLLPGILSLLALDSWHDHHALKNLVRDTYDAAMLDSVNVLRSNLALTQDGSLRLNQSLVAQMMPNAAHPTQKYFHVGLTPGENAGDIAATSRQELTLLGNADLPAAPTATASAGPAPTVWYDSHYRGSPVRMVAIQSKVTDGHGRRFDLLIQAAESTGPRNQAQTASLQQELLRDARMLLVVLVLVWLGVTWSLHPLEQLRKSVLQSKGKHLQPLNTRRVPHEVAPLVDAINQHIARYRDLLEQQSQFLADASHQLRTPLAIMLTQAGVALREKEPERYRETLRAIVAQISRSRRLCEQLLSLAHTSDTTPPAELPRIVDLNTVARDVVLQYLTLAHEKNHDLGWVDAREALPAPATRAELAPGDELALSGRPAAPVTPVLACGCELHEALANLVHNAIVHTPPGGQITVTVSSRDGMAFAEVCDDGPGVAKTRRAGVFERFQQAIADPDNGPRGAGLGLAIARAYAKRNGGDVELADTAAPAPDTVPRNAGLRAILQLPLATSSASQS